AAVLYVLPEKGSEGSTMLSDPADIEYPLTIPAELAGRSFIAAPTVPWLTVAPSSGSVPAGGLILSVVAHTPGLPPGTTTGSVALSSSAGGALGALDRNTTTTQVSVNLVAPYVSAAKNTPPPDALIIPAVANVAGVNARFQSDVRICNTSAQVMKYQITFVPT